MSKRVLFINSTGQIGGAEYSLLDLLAGLDRSRYEPLLLSLGDGPLLARARELAVETRALPVPRAFSRISFRGARSGPVRMTLGAVAMVPSLARLRQLVKVRKIDIVHANGNKALAVMLPATRASSCRTVWHQRDFLLARRRERFMVSLVDRAVDAVVTSSKAVAAQVMQLGLRPSRVHTIYGGVDCDRFSPDGAVADLRTDFGWPESSRLVGLVGMLAPWKGQEIFLEAAGAIAQEHPDARFVVIGAEIYSTDGHGAFRARLERLCSRLELRRLVGFTGYRDDMADVMRGLDIVVHASVEPEPFGRVIAEAMACSRPVIATDGGGAPEITGRDAVAARLVPMGDAPALAGAIASILGDPINAARMAVAARQRIGERFSLALHADRIHALYEQLI